MPRRERQHRRGSRARSPGKEPAGGRGAGTRARPCPGGQPLSERTLLHRITPAQAAGSGATSRGPGPAPPRSVSRCLRSPMLVATDACGHCRLRSVPFARSRWKRSRTRGGFIPDPRLADGAAVPALRGAAPMVKSTEFNGFEGIFKGDGNGERGRRERTGGTYLGGGRRVRGRARSVAAAAAGTERSGCGSPRRAAAPQLLPKFHRSVPHVPVGWPGFRPELRVQGRGFSPFRLSLSAFRPGEQRVPGASGLENKRAPPAKKKKKIMRVLRERDSGLGCSGVSRLG